MKTHAHIALVSRPGVGSTRPVFTDGSLSGLDIREPLFRFDANVHLPTRERGVTSANRVGEPLASLHVQWRTLEESSSAAAGAVGPAVPTQLTASQRFVLQSGTISFRSRGAGTVRFYGTGRTYPATTDGKARLLFAGTATVLEGTGTVAGARGTLSVTGDITQSTIAAITVVGRFDAGSAVSVEDTLEPLLDLPCEPDATVFVLIGEPGEGGIERLRVARIGNDLASGSRLRSLLRIGGYVGMAHSPTPNSRVLTFTDPSGLPIGSIAALNLEGSVVRYGPATHGTGSLAGAGGVIAVEAIQTGGAPRTKYVLRLVDPKGRFRPSFTDVYKPQTALPVVDGPPEPAPPESLAFVDGAGGSMTSTDVAILRYAERSLADGMELANWWAGKERSNSYEETFDIGHEYKEGSRSFGFFDTAAVGSSSVPVMGIVHEMFYDRQKALNAAASRDQLKEFVFKYFMRVSRLPENGRRHPFGYRQRYFKHRDSSKIGKFLGDTRAAVVDLRDLGAVYDWLVLEVDSFDFNLSFAPFGSAAPRVHMPLTESTFLVLGPPFLRNQDDPEPGVLGHYGFGYAFVPYAPGGRGLIAYGPGHLAAAIQQLDFTVMADGEIRVRATFVVNRPNRIAQLDFDPIEWGFKLADVMSFGVASRVMSPVRDMAGSLPLRVSGLDPISTYLWMANAITNGFAGRRLGHSKAELEKRMLAQHFRQHHALLTSSLLVWRMVADWMDEERLPTFVREGVA